MRSTAHDMMDLLSPVATPEQMRNIDRHAIDDCGIPGLELMERAGRGIAEYIRDVVLAGDVSGQNIAIVCGRGNNGGDGFVIGRYLAEWGAKPTFYLLSEIEKVAGDAKANLDRARQTGSPIVTVADPSQLAPVGDADLIVDAIFGTGFRGAAEGLAATAIAAMNDADADVVAVDCPSGLDAVTGRAEGATVRARFTVTLALHKWGLWTYPGRNFAGRVHLVDIGIPTEAVTAEAIDTSLITSAFVGATLPQRPGDAHKGICGKAYILAGSAGMTGAAVMAANAALKGGVGLAYVGTAKSCVDPIDIGALEALVRPLPDVRDRRCLALRALGEIRSQVADVDALAIGPGIGLHHQTGELVRRLVATRTLPTVVDADGLSALAKGLKKMRDDGDGSSLDCKGVLGGHDLPRLILTPHVGEMARLLGWRTEDIAADRAAAAREAAREFGAVVVMKGAPTFVVDGADPSAAMYLNPTGNAGMATGGSGDVLTGLIVSLLAQACAPLVAALAGVYLHGLAGDFAAAEIGQRAMTAGDLITYLPEAILQVEAERPT